MNESIRVLHVDDDPEFLELATILLEREDDRFVVETATGADAGLDRLDADAFDCVVSDYDMPKTNGIEFLEAVRVEYPELPFILFTGKGSEEVAGKAITAGVTDYLQKTPGSDQYTLLANRIVNAVTKRRAQTNYRELFDTTHVGLALHDPQTGHVTDANRAFGRMLGRDRSTLIGSHPGEFSPEGSEYDQEAGTAVVREASEGRSKTIEWQVETADGDLIWVEVHLARATIDGQTQVLAVVQDISDRKRRERKLDQLRERTRELTYTYGTEETASLAVDAADDIIGAPLSGVFLPNEDGTSLDLSVMADSVPEMFDRIPSFSRDGPPGSRAALVWEVYREREPVYVDRLSESDRITEESPAESVLLYPIGTHGVFVVSSPDPEAFSDTDRLLVEILANNLETALDRVEREETLRTRERRLERLHEATRELIESDSETAIAERIVRAAEEILAFSILVVRLYDSDEGGLVPVAASDAVDDVMPERSVFTPDGDSLNWAAFEAGEVRIYDDIERLEYAVDQGSGLRSLMILPMGEYGTIAVGETDSDAFDDTDEFLARILTTAAETALDTVKREAQLRRRRDELERQIDRLDEFASVVSHDLRTPLLTAQGRLELAREEPEPEHFDAVCRAHDRMESLIDDILTLAREGDVIGDREWVDLSSIVDECFASFETANATLVSTTGRSVYADRGRLQQLLENLFHNSVEHGSTNVPTDQRESVDDDGHVRIEVGDLKHGSGFFVADDGPGIPESLRSDVFDAGFTTSDRGTGFGLRIVEQIVDAHGWEIELFESEYGGVRFEISGVSTRE